MTNTPRRWSDFLLMMKAKCSAVAYSNWLEPIRAGNESEGLLELVVPNVYVREYLLNNFASELCTFFGADSRDHLPVTFKVIDVKPTKVCPVQTNKAPRPRASLNLNRLYTFDHFIEGSENAFIKSCATACAGAPGTLYNPLFIHAPAGLGKTHLLHSIAAEARRINPQAKIECMTTEGFITELVDALKSKSVDRMKRRLRSCDLLLIDDIQFLQNRLNFEEELIHTIEALLNRGGQVVVTADCPPDELKLSERIRSRFLSGLVAPIHMPGPETRAAILQHKASLRAIDLPDEVALFLSDRPMTSVRLLEGIVNRLCAHVQMTGEPLTCERAAAITRDLLPGAKTTKASASLSSIIRAAASHYGVESAEIKGKKRTARLSEARSVAMYLARSLVDMPLVNLARLFNRSHSTLLWACEKVTKQDELHRAAEQIRLKLA